MKHEWDVVAVVSMASILIDIQSKNEKKNIKKNYLITKP